MRLARIKLTKLCNFYTATAYLIQNSYYRTTQSLRGTDWQSQPHPDDTQADESR